jgi:flavodoxin
MKTLVVYYSHSGNNQLLAEELRERLGADLFRIETVRKTKAFSIFLDILLDRAPQIKDFFNGAYLYDHYVLVAPIWAGRIAAPMKSFILSERGRLDSYSFITLCGGATGKRAKVFNCLSRLTKQEPDQVMELGLKDFVAETKKGQGQSVSKLLLQKNELSFFDRQISNFVKRIRSPLSA